MGESGQIVGDEPLVDGMAVSVRLRYDFTVTDADRLLAAARQRYRDLNPDASTEDAVAMVTCAADALFTVLEHVGVLGDLVDGRLAGYGPEGLTVVGWRAHVTCHEPHPLRAGADCLRTDDVFALPTPNPDRV